MINIEMRINASNHSKYDLDGAEYAHWGSDWKNALDIMCDVDRALESNLPNSRDDLAGKYHGWLSSFGISPETENGWWSKAAINPSNIESFIKMRTDEEYDERCETILRAINLLNRIGTFKSKFQTVDELLEEWKL